MDQRPGAGGPLHRRLLGVPDIRSGCYHTAWLEEFLA